MSNNPLAVVIDANILIAICAKEQDIASVALNALSEYGKRGATLFAPNVLVAEVLYILCQKAAQNLLTPTAHQQALIEFTDYLKTLNPPPGGEASLVARAEAVRGGYGCSRTSDGLYIALAEQLSANWSTEILTFDNGYSNQTANHVPTVTVNVLTV